MKRWIPSQWVKVNIIKSMSSHLWILRTSNFCLLHLKMPVTKKIDLQRRTISTLLGSYTPVSVPYTLFTLINQTSCCSSLLLLKPSSTPAIKFQYLYTCVITCLATVSNIQQPHELFVSLGTRSKQTSTSMHHRASR